LSYQECAISSFADQVVNLRETHPDDENAVTGAGRRILDSR
jgi:hypothetical protein